MHACAARGPAILRAIVLTSTMHGKKIKMYPKELNSMTEGCLSI
jgi:hypothetical protein